MESSDSEGEIDDTPSQDGEETAMLGAKGRLPVEALRADRLPGDRFGRYRIRRILGEGAMGFVYLAHDTQLHRKVALKIPKLDSQQDTKFVARFLREARAAATLSHPGICPVYDVGEIDGTHFIAMAYIQGQPLSEFVNPDKPQSERGVAIIVRKIALALHDAHINGLIHRDVKPANIMIDQRNEPIVMDFGLARQVDDGGQDSDDARLTTEGAILGSPAYMSPEQIEGRSENIGPACDIYSLGVIFYELLTGQLPFQGSIASIIAQIVTKQPGDPRSLRPDISPRLSAICLGAIAKRIEERPATMKAFAAELADFLKSREKERARRIRQQGDRHQPEGTDSDTRLEVTAKPIEVTCRCGQPLIAQRHLAGKTVKCPRCNDLTTLPEVTDESQMDVACDNCGQRFKAHKQLAGKVVKCTTCSQPIAVPAPGAPQAQRQIPVACACGQQFLANRELAGRTVKCSSCGNPLTIPF